MNREKFGVSLNTECRQALSRDRGDHGSTAGLHALTVEQAVSYWLMPCPRAVDDFEALSKLARRGLQGCSLPPHITLYSDHLDNTANAINRLSQVAEGRRPLQLCPTAIEAGPLFTMSLILRFAAGEELIHWFTRLRARSPSRLDYRFRPHLSLLYSSATLTAKQAMAAQLPLPAPARFNRLAVVIHPLTINTDADIAAVTTLHECTLA